LHGKQKKYPQKSTQNSCQLRPNGPDSKNVCDIRYVIKIKIDWNLVNSAKNEKKTKFGSAILDQESSPAKQDQLVASIFDEIKKQAESVQSPVIFNHELIQGSSLINVEKSNWTGSSAPSMLVTDVGDFLCWW